MPHKFKETFDFEEDEIIQELERFGNLKPAVRFRIRQTLKERFNSCSVRTRNCVPYMHEAEEAIRLLYVYNPSTRIKNCGAKTHSEICSFLDKFRQDLETEYDLRRQEQEEMQPEFSSEEYLYLIKGKYDFLDIEDCRKIAEAESQSEHFPFIYVARKYVELLRHRNRNVRIITLSYGIGEETAPRSMDQLASEFSMTRERVRQIIGKGITLPPELDEEINKNIVSKLDNITSFDDPFWETVSKQYSIDDNATEVCMLVGAILSDYTIIQLEPDDCRYLINKSLLKNSTLKTAYAKLKMSLIQRRLRDEELDIHEYLMCKGKKYHPEYVRLSEVIARNVRSRFGFEIRDNRWILATQNKLNNFEAMEEILLEYGRPMRAEDMWEIFCERYPDAGIQKFTSFKAYLVTNKRILPRGKTGTYIHDSWEHYFAGSANEYVAHLITTNKRRYSIDHLIQLISEEFAPTNRNNVIASLRMDQKREFVIYQDDTVGLRGVVTINDRIPEKKIVRRCSFDRRFEDLKNFIKLHGRLPYSGEDADEAALARWIYNMDKRKIDITDEQYRQYNEFKKDCERLPRTRIEYKCREKCRQIIDLLKENMENPMFRLSAIDKFWIRKTFKGSSNFLPSDHRHEYLGELRETLRQTGYNIDI